MYNVFMKFKYGEGNGFIVDQGWWKVEDDQTVECCVIELMRLYDIYKYNVPCQNFNKYIEILMNKTKFLNTSLYLTV